MENYVLIQMINREPVLIVSGSHEDCIAKLFQIAMEDVDFNSSNIITKRESDYGLHFEVNNRDFYVQPVRR